MHRPPGRQNVGPADHRSPIRKRDQQRSSLIGKELGLADHLLRGVVDRGDGGLPTRSHGRAGHRVTGNRRQDSEGVGWEYVRVCVDDYSRLAYAEVLPDERQESAVAFLDRAAQWFAQFGVTVRRVLTDNGSCYRSRMFMKRCRELDIRKKFTRPYRPQANGKAERFIQTLLREWAYFRSYKTSNERSVLLPRYLTHYNEHRQHGSLGYKPPITRLPGVHNVAGIHS